MKKQLFVLCLLTMTLFACKNGEEKEKVASDTVSEVETRTSSPFKTFNGEFIYIADGAVLKGKNFIYGVTIDEKMHELAEMVAPIKKDDILGTLKVTYKNEAIEEYDLFAFEDVKKLNVFSRLMKSINFLIWGDV